MIENILFLILIISIIGAISQLPILRIIQKKIHEKRIRTMPAMKCLKYGFRKDRDDVAITVGTIQNGKCNWTVYDKHGVELPQEIHTYEIASITKTITGALVERAVQDGKINIDDSIDKYLELTENKNYPTIRELLTHTSGYRSIYIEKIMFKNLFRSKNLLRGITDKMIIRRLGKIKSNKNKNWHYSNFNFAVLGVMLEKVYNTTYADLANQFLEEQGMMGTHISTGKGDFKRYWKWNKNDAYLATGAITSNIKDMFTYAQKQLEKKEPFCFTHKILKDVTTHYPCCSRVDAMGAAWRVDKKRGFIWHNGATDYYKSYLGFCPKTNTAVIILSNSDRSKNAIHIESNVGIKMLESLQIA